MKRRDIHCVHSHMLASLLSVNTNSNLSPAVIHHKSNTAAAVLDAMIRDFCSLALICLLLTSCEPWLIIWDDLDESPVLHYFSRLEDWFGAEGNRQHKHNTRLTETTHLETANTAFGYCCRRSRSPSDDDMRLCRGRLDFSGFVGMSPSQYLFLFPQHVCKAGFLTNSAANVSAVAAVSWLAVIKVFLKST